MIEYVLTDEQINDIIDELLDWTTDKRLDSRGAWAYMYDKAMTQWDEMHPNTRPPAYEKVGPPPPCFQGKLPPIYAGELGDITVACKPGTYKI